MCLFFPLLTTKTTTKTTTTTAWSYFSFSSSAENVWTFSQFYLSLISFVQEERKIDRILWVKLSIFTDKCAAARIPLSSKNKQRNNFPKNFSRIFKPNVDRFYQRIRSTFSQMDFSFSFLAFLIPFWCVFLLSILIAFVLNSL